MLLTPLNHVDMLYLSYMCYTLTLMSMLNVRLTDDDELKLAQILASTKMQNKSELIKRLINDQWTALQAGRTFIERRGGHPDHLLTETPNMSNRAVRKAKLAEHYAHKSARRKQSI